MILNGGIYAHHRVISRATVAEFTAHQTIGNSARTLGWDVALDPTATGRFFRRGPLVTTDSPARHCG